MDVLTNFLSLLAVGLLVMAIPIVVAGVFQWSRQKIAEIKHNLSSEQLTVIEKGIEMAVRASEQVGLSGKLSGREKLDYAVAAAQKYLDRTNVQVSLEEIITLLEAEVHSQFNNYAPPIDSPETRNALLEKAIETAVMAAEQTGAKKMAVEVATNIALSKKDYATQLAQKYLTEHGITVDTTLIDGMIEAQIMKFKLKALEWKATGTKSNTE